MSRAPFAEWRTLLAAGGAPAASHAALERVPVHTRLLAPLANTPLVREGNFDALMRPVELAAVLGRHVAGQRAAPDSSTDATEDVEAAGRRVRTREVERRTSSRSAVAAVEGAPRSGARDAWVRRHPLPLREPKRPRMGDATESARPTGAVGPAEARVVSAGVRRRVAGATGEHGASHPRGDASYAMTLRSEQTRTAAITAIAVDAASPPVRRLLDAVAASNSASSGAGARDESNAAHPSSAGERSVSAIERALERIATRKTSPASADGTGRASESRRLEPARGTGITERAARFGAPLEQTVSANAPQHAPLTTTTAATAGGFRGLAERAMRQSDGATPAVSVAAPRLTHEVRTISDLPLDALDASVADSVTRILQREARRHGIDLAGTGA